MTDIKIAVDEDGADLVIENGDLALDEGLMTPLLVSLFTDGRASEADPGPLPGDDGDPRGYWHDSEQDRWGSKLWLLQRAIANKELLIRARDYTLEATQWMRDIQLAEDVQVATSYTAPGKMRIEVTPVRGRARRWPKLWQGNPLPPVDLGGVSIHVLPIDS